MTTGKDPGKCEVFKDNKGEWRWHAVASNGKTVAASTEGYVNKSDCVNNAKMLGYSDYKELKK